MKWILSARTPHSAYIGEAFVPSGDLLRGMDLGLHLGGCIDWEDWIHRCDQLNGSWAAICHSTQDYYLAVDHRATRMLYYREVEGELWVSESGFELLLPQEYTIEPKPKIALYFSRWGFTPLEDTLHPQIKRIPAGYTLRYHSSGEVELRPYTGAWRPIQAARDLSYLVALERMQELMEQAMDRMVQVIGARPIVLPLTGGRDSRLIATSLVRRGLVEQTHACTYGRHRASREVERASRVAEQLGLRHDFVCTIPQGYSTEGYVYDEEALGYLEYIGGLGSGYFFGEYTSGRHYAEQLQSQAIVLPGHAGDILGGAHLQYVPRTGRQHRQHNLQQLLYFEGAGRRLSQQEARVLMELLAQQYALYPEEWSEADRFESFRTLEISSKYYINSARGWRYWGHSVWMPYLDRDLTDFVYSLPAQYRHGKRIYEELTDRYFSAYGVNYPDDSSEWAESRLWSFRLKQYLRPYLARYLSDRRLLLSDDDDMGFARLMGGLLREQTEQHIPWQPNTINGLSFAWWLYYLRELRSS